ncbi:MAG: trypsin-like peptidase domain-containing protein [Candidatus Nomurabacteria bacterium]|nr:MAG: trypsin-like peptidase domain-containing protein [Candidatus Nomurabacteria bacterium]
MIEKVGAVLASATLLSGCGSNIVNALNLTPAYTEINLDSLPETLPDAVTQQIPNVVALTDNIPFLSQTEYCSGVRVDQRDYLSAGHCDYQLASNALTLCVDMSISSQSAITADGESIPVIKKAGTFTGDTSGKVNIVLNNAPEDALLVETAYEPLPYSTPTHFRDSSSEISPGTPLYLVNYEPTADNRLRSPYAKDLYANELQAGLNKPAIFGAIALKQFSDGTTMAIAGIKSYSMPPETDARGGSSGGPVYDAAGNLVGTTINLFNYSSLPEVENDLGVTFKNSSNETGVNVFLIQDSTPSLIDDLQAKQQPTDGC